MNFFVGKDAGGYFGAGTIDIVRAHVDAAASQVCTTIPVMLPLPKKFSFALLLFLLKNPRSDLICNKVIIS